MSTTVKASAAVLVSALAVCALATPASAGTSTVVTAVSTSAGSAASSMIRSTVWSAEQSATEALNAAVADARATYARDVAAAREQRSEQLAVPRAIRDATLAIADSKFERRLARSAYRRAAAPIKADYALARKAAVTTRNAAIEVALAAYLASGRSEFADALSAYHDATTRARDTLALALGSATQTLRTDTAHDRADLLDALATATTDWQRGVAWREYFTATASERAAHTAAITGARSTYFSAMRQARAVFRAETGVGVRTLMRKVFPG